MLTWIQRDLTGAAVHYQRALALNPSDMMAHAFLGLVLPALGRPREGDAHNRRMIALDPISAFSYVFAANNWATSGDFAAAEIAASEAIIIDPRYPEGYHMRGYNRNYLGRFQDSYDDLVRAAELGNPTAWPLAKRCGALAGMGRFDEIRALLQDVLSRRETEFMTPDAIGCIHQFLGQNDEAFRWLEVAVEELALWVPFIGIDALFSPLRRDPRFVNFCDRHRIPVHRLPPNAFDGLVLPAQ